MIENAISHAASALPNESCGLVVIHNGKERYVACQNIARNPKTDFEIKAEDYVKASRIGQIVAVVHSHPFAKTTPSEADKVACEKSGLRWIIVNPTTREVTTFEPSGYEPKLYGREYHHGILDCYSFAIDYYKQVCGITLPDYPRGEEWWLHGGNLYQDYFEVVGFREIKMSELRQHDALLMTIESPVMNHGAIYLGQNNIGHHLYRRLSSRDVYGQFYRERTNMAIRHKDLF